MKSLKHYSFLAFVGIVAAFAVVAVVGPALDWRPREKPSTLDCEDNSVSSPGISRDLLLEALKTQDTGEIADVLQCFKFEQHAGDYYPLLVQLWNLDRKSYPELQWEKIDTDTVRIHLASILLQADRNRQIDLVQRTEFHEFVRRALSSPDREVFLNSIILLSVIGEDKDVDSLVNIVLTYQDLVSRKQAIIGLAETCNALGVVELRRLEGEVIQSELKEFIAHWIRQAELDEYRNEYCGR